ncbi:DUF4276 family protein [Xanthomonas oryzae]|uniref:DUF4276 family protein n=1 Tax=Xanthomonas oryzae TaxID=347 RepID=UPI001E525042|nr:DUF4276 family protein [Xanthomonas oryzae]UUC37427.2 DUF4276 family protein [Xanthomonas oryzae pv. oryzae]UUF78812.1 DUF4276 family protein [Xanthomonas oryzae pv. oryzae]WAY24789.1 DUF4276 family protein [Xanthomonas oryzae pv. oryzae]WDM97961.1 DUF4276 family protein [Xanthomonas oryzae]WDN00740.1 DUF4276 family protein [Xanthomonas oryzae]
MSNDIQYRLIAFEGKQDLEKQLERRIRGYQNSLARFVILRDLDSHPDCRAVKKNLLGICRLSGKIQFCLVRIACTELETFYLADLAAVGMALQMSRLASHQNNRKFRSPDAIGNPSKELKLITGNRYQKVAGSREIGKYLQLDNARSASFRNLVTGVRRMETELLAIPV